MGNCCLPATNMRVPRFSIVRPYKSYTLIATLSLFARFSSRLVLPFAGLGYILKLLAAACWPAIISEEATRLVAQLPAVGLLPVISRQSTSAKALDTVVSNRMVFRPATRLTLAVTKEKTVLPLVLGNDIAEFTVMPFTINLPEI